MHNETKNKFDAFSEDELNRLGIKQLYNNNFFEAFLLLKFAADTMGSYLAHHNLGCFYYEIGGFGEDGKEFGVDALCAEKHLQIANQLNENYFSLCELGKIYYQSDQFETANTVFYSSLRLKSTWYNHNMLGCIFMKEKKYDEAQNYYKEAYRLCTLEDEKYFILANYGVCLSFLRDFGAHKISQVLMNLYTENGDITYITACIYMLFNLDAFQKVIAYYEIIKNKIAISKDLFKIYLISFSKINSGEIDVFYRELVSELADIYLLPNEITYYQEVLACVKQGQTLAIEYFPYELYQNNFME